MTAKNHSSPEDIIAKNYHACILKDHYGMVQRDDINTNAIQFMYPELVIFQAPKPTTWMDSVGLRHDREVVSNNSSSCETGNNRSACRNQMRSANDNFVKGFAFGIASGKIFHQKWNHVISDLFVGAAGTLMFELDNLSMNISNFDDLKRIGSRGQYLGEQMELFEESMGGALKWGVFFKSGEGDKRDPAIIVQEIIRHEIERMVKKYIEFEAKRSCHSNTVCMGSIWYFVVNNPTIFTF
jgi:hypothetical protein